MAQPPPPEEVMPAATRPARRGPGTRSHPDRGGRDRAKPGGLGPGTRTGARGGGGGAQAGVDLGAGTGSKWLLLRYAPIEKL